MKAGNFLFLPCSAPAPAPGGGGRDDGEDPLVGLVANESTFHVFAADFGGFRREGGETAGTYASPAAARDAPASWRGVSFCLAFMMLQLLDLSAVRGAVTTRQELKELLHKKPRAAGTAEAARVAWGELRALVLPATQLCFVKLLDALAGFAPGPDDAPDTGRFLPWDDQQAPPPPVTPAEDGEEGGQHKSERGNRTGRKRGRSGGADATPAQTRSLARKKGAAAQQQQQKNSRGGSGAGGSRRPPGGSGAGGDDEDDDEAAPPPPPPPAPQQQQSAVRNNNEMRDIASITAAFDDALFLLAAGGAASAPRERDC